jgi:hypothetical protein
VDLQPVEKFYTPFTSPRHLIASDNDDEQQNPETNYSSFTSSWLRRNNSQSGSSRINKQQQKSTSGALELDPFVIPEGYTWSNSGDDKSKKLNKSKSLRRSK